MTFNYNIDYKNDFKLEPLTSFRKILKAHPKKKLKKVNKTEIDIRHKFNMDYDDEEPVDDPRVIIKEQNNRILQENMRKNTRIRSILDQSPSKIRSDRILHKYAPTHNLYKKPNNFNKFLVETQRKVANEESDFKKNINTHVNSKIGIPDLLAMNNHLLNRKIVDKYQMKDEKNYNKYGNAIVNYSKRLKTFIQNKSKLDGREESYVANKQFHVEHWKDFLQDYVTNQQLADAKDGESMNHILEENFKRQIMEILAKKKFALETMIDTCVSNKCPSNKENLLLSGNYEDTFKIIKDNTPFKDNHDEYQNDFKRRMRASVANLRDYFKAINK